MNGPTRNQERFSAHIETERGRPARPENGRFPSTPAGVSQVPAAASKSCLWPQHKPGCGKTTRSSPLAAPPSDANIHSDDTLPRDTGIQNTSNSLPILPAHDGLDARFAQNRTLRRKVVRNRDRARWRMLGNFLSKLSFKNPSERQSSSDTLVAYYFEQIVR
jgi:hypothetical protein